MDSYLSILRNILDNGIEKYPTRTIGNKGEVDGSIRTIGLPNVNFFHNMEDGFPLITTKKMAFKTFCVELEGFIQGIRSKEWYKERGCNIWNEWANPNVVRNKRSSLEYLDLGVELSDREIQEKVNDLGPIYGVQWRNFDASKYDQLDYIVKTLKENPYDRRMVCSAWNPCQFNEMALLPCHLLWNVTVYGDSLHLSWHQRSVDTLLGLPANIMSYALLLILLSKEAGLKPGTLAGRLMDCHLYENQLEAAKEQLSRKPFPLPTLTIPDKMKSGHDFSIYNWTHNDVILENYQCHPQLKVKVVV